MEDQVVVSTRVDIDWTTDEDQPCSDAAITDMQHFIMLTISQYTLKKYLSSYIVHNNSKILL